MQRFSIKYLLRKMLVFIQNICLAYLFDLDKIYPQKLIAIFANEFTENRYKMKKGLHLIPLI